MDDEGITPTGEASNPNLGPAIQQYLGVKENADELVTIVWNLLDWEHNKPVPEESEDSEDDLTRLRDVNKKDFSCQQNLMS